MKKIEKLSVYELLEMYESEIQRNHYDPCGSMKKQPFNKYELREEITRRLDENQ